MDLQGGGTGQATKPQGQVGPDLYTDGKKHRHASPIPRIRDPVYRLRTSWPLRGPEQERTTKQRPEFSSGKPHLQSRSLQTAPAFRPSTYPSSCLGASLLDLKSPSPRPLDPTQSPQIKRRISSSWAISQRQQQLPITAEHQEGKSSKG